MPSYQFIASQFQIHLFFLFSGNKGRPFYTLSVEDVGGTLEESFFLPGYVRCAHLVKLLQSGIFHRYLGPKQQNGTSPTYLSTNSTLNGFQQGSMALLRAVPRSMAYPACFLVNHLPLIPLLLPGGFL